MPHVQLGQQKQGQQQQGQQGQQQGQGLCEGPYHVTGDHKRGACSHRDWSVHITSQLAKPVAGNL